MSAPAEESGNRFGPTSDAYYIHLIVGQGFKKVKARAVVIPGWEDWDLFVHRTHKSSRRTYRVSEGMTGYSLPCEDGYTPEKAIEYATKKLSQTDKLVARDKRREAVKRWGLSPRYAPTESVTR